MLNATSPLAHFAVQLCVLTLLATGCAREQADDPSTDHRRQADDAIERCADALDRNDIEGCAGLASMQSPERGLRHFFADDLTAPAPLPVVVDMANAMRNRRFSGQDERRVQYTIDLHSSDGAAITLPLYYYFTSEEKGLAIP